MNAAARWLQTSLAPRIERAPAAARTLAAVYGGAARLHRAVYDARLLRQRTLACQVVSVGSLVAGGAGKTPTAAWIAAGLHRRGVAVVLASRGYGRRSRSAVDLVSDGRRLLCRPEEAGDEPVVLATAAPGVPVLVGRDRGLVGLRAVSVHGAEVLVLDDGFQHLRLHRDIDLLTFDAALGLGNRRVLPAGPLRERAAELARAHAIGVVDGELSPSDEAIVSRHAPDALRYRATRRPTRLTDHAQRRSEPIEALAGLEVGVVCGLARPEGFERTLERLGAKVVARRHFPDHHPYAPEDLHDLRRDAECWITSEKDAVKIPPRWSRDVALKVLGSELEVADGEALLDWLEVRLAAVDRRG